MKEAGKWGNNSRLFQHMFALLGRQNDLSPQNAAAPLGKKLHRHVSTIHKKKHRSQTVGASFVFDELVSWRNSSDKFRQFPPGQNVLIFQSPFQTIICSNLLSFIPIIYYLFAFYAKTDRLMFTREHFTPSTSVLFPQTWSPQKSSFDCVRGLHWQCTQSSAETVPTYKIWKTRK